MKKIFLIAFLFVTSFAEAQMTQIQITSIKRYTTYAEVTYKMRFTLPAVLGTGANPIQGVNSIVSTYAGYNTEIIPVTGTVITYTGTESIALTLTINQIQSGLLSRYSEKQAEINAFVLAPYDNLIGLAYNGSWSSVGNITDAPLSTDLNTGINTTAATGQAVTLTIPAFSNRYHSICYISITAYSTAARTGSATPVTVTTTNLNGLSWTFSTAAAIGVTDEKSIQAPTRSAVANTATTIVCPATAGVIWRVQVFYKLIN